MVKIFLMILASSSSGLSSEVAFYFIVPDEGMGQERKQGFEQSGSIVS